MSGQGNDIYNLREGNDDVMARYGDARDFYTKLWNTVGNKVQFLQPSK